jgi:hypothetical protein
MKAAKKLKFTPNPLATAERKKKRGISRSQGFIAIESRFFDEISD